MVFVSFALTHSVPISKALATLIKEQQVTVTNEWGDHELLFPVPEYIKPILAGTRRKKLTNRGKQWMRKTLATYLDQFAEKHHIVGEDGNPWKFTFHQFRHTIATTMINNQIPQHIVQRFLGHESPTMTSQYAHIHDQTLKEAFSKFIRGQIVNIAGESVAQTQIVKDLSVGSNNDDIDVQWLKHNIMAQSLPNGLCALPVVSNACPHANSCLTCVNFRTDHRFLLVHKQQLEKTKAIIVQAKTHGWQRQIEMNTKVQTNLEKIIMALEGSTHGT